MRQTIRRLEFELTITNAQGHSGYVTSSTHDQRAVEEAGSEVEVRRK